MADQDITNKSMLSVLHWWWVSLPENLCSAWRQVWCYSDGWRGLLTSGEESRALLNILQDSADPHNKNYPFQYIKSADVGKLWLIRKQTSQDQESNYLGLNSASTWEVSEWHWPVYLFLSFLEKVEVVTMHQKVIIIIKCLELYLYIGNN